MDWTWISEGQLREYLRVNRREVEVGEKRGGWKMWRRICGR
jgi:hypothetical protein